MEAARHFLPSEEHNSHEGALHEERHDAFDGKRSAEDVAHEPGIVAPVGTELELKNNACGYAHREIHSKEALPELGSFFPEGLSCTIIDGLHDGHDYGKAEGEGHEQPMINGSKRKLGSRPVNKGWVDCHNVISY